MKLELINFEATDRIKLEGILYNCENYTKKVILSVHGMGSNCLKKRDQILAEYANRNNIDYFAFNNRGSELARYLYTTTSQKILGGTSNEDVLDSYYDIKGAIQKLTELGYEKIYLLGHSLGCTKIVYTYLELLKNREEEWLSKIKAILLLSLVDIHKVIKVFSHERITEFLKYAEQKEEIGEIEQLMPKEAFTHPISVKTYLRYVKYYDIIDFAQYSNKNYAYKELNSIEIPLFMRWGNVNELLEQNLDELLIILKQKLHNKKLDIAYINGADHSYTGKETILAEEMIDFLKEYN